MPIEMNDAERAKLIAANPTPQPQTDLTTLVAQLVRWADIALYQELPAGPLMRDAANRLALLEALMPRIEAADKQSQRCLGCGWIAFGSHDPADCWLRDLLALRGDGQ